MDGASGISLSATGRRDEVADLNAVVGEPFVHAAESRRRTGSCFGDQEGQALHRARVAILRPPRDGRLARRDRIVDRLERFPKPEATYLGIAACVEEKAGVIDRPWTERDDTVGKFRALGHGAECRSFVRLLVDAGGYCLSENGLIRNRVRQLRRSPGRWLSLMWFG
jgi:hypothetical protein